MFIGLLSDTHLSEPDNRLKRLLSADLGEAEVIMHAGDFMGESVVDYLEYVEPRRFVGVAGNMDSARLAARLSIKKVLELSGFKIGLIHGVGAPESLTDRMLSAFDPAPDIIIHGHSHAPTDVVRGGVRIINPGSAFEGRPSPGSVALLRLERNNVDVIFKETTS